MSGQAVTIRATMPPDLNQSAGLVTVGRRPYRPGRSLVAEIDGTTVAAISLTTGAVAADLDRADTGMVRRLRYRRYEMLRQGGHVLSARMLPPRRELHAA